MNEKINSIPSAGTKAEQSDTAQETTSSQPIGNTMLAAVPMWTMVAKNYYNRSRLHIANSTFVTYCGRDNMLVRDYVEFQNGFLKRLEKQGKF